MIRWCLYLQINFFARFLSHSSSLNIIMFFCVGCGGQRCHIWICVMCVCDAGLYLSLVDSTAFLRYDLKQLSYTYITLCVNHVCIYNFIISHIWLSFAAWHR